MISVAGAREPICFTSKPEPSILPIQLIASCIALAGTDEWTEGVPAAIGQGALAHMPVREASVFKDGHAYVLSNRPPPTGVVDYSQTAHVFSNSTM